jgi:cytochrome P450
MVGEKLAVKVIRTAIGRPKLMSALSPVLSPYNPFTDAFYEDPYPTYEAVRERGRVVRQRSLQAWIVTSFEDCEAVLRSPAASVDRTEPLNTFEPYISLDDELRTTLSKTLLMTDPPAHTRLRRLVNRAFTPNAVSRMRPKVEALCEEMLDRVSHKAGPDGRIDFVEDLAAPFPIYVITEMLGLPAEDRAFVKTTSDEIVRVLDGVVGFDPEVMTRSVRMFWEYLDDIIEQRRRSPTDDLISALVSVEEDGDYLSLLELRGLVMLLMAAGHETTTGLLSNSLTALSRFPDQRERLGSDPDIVESAIEELVRFDSPVQSTDRFLRQDLDIAGTVMPSGDLVIVLLAAANRDPERFDSPNELILDRPDIRSLSFGNGVHHCLGAALARMEAATLLPRFIRRFPAYTVQTDEIEYKRSWTLRGARELTVKLGTAQGPSTFSPEVHAS